MNLRFAHDLEIFATFREETVLLGEMMAREPARNESEGPDDLYNITRIIY